MSTVIRVEKTQNYSVISNEFLRNKELSLKAKGLLAVCLSLPDTWTFSMKGLVAISKESITAIRNCMRELEEHGYMKVNKLKNDKGQFYYQYVIYEKPEHQKPATGELDIDNAEVGSLDIENVNQLNKDILSTENKVSNNDLYLYIEEQAPPAIQPLLKDYLEMRQEKGTPLDMRSLKMLLKRIEKLSNNTTIQKMMLENAIQNGWQNVYRPSDQEIEAASKALVENLRSLYNI